MTNEILECIKTRRSIRKFRTEQILDEEMDAILEAAVWAPSGANSQSWLFTAIQSPVVLAELNKVLRETILNSDSAAVQHMKAGAAKEGVDYFFHAPTIVIASNKSDYINALSDCALGMENMMLAAHSIGIGSCWTNVFRRLTDETPLRRYLAALGIPLDHMICGTLTMGYPDMCPSAPPRKDGTIHRIK